VPGSFLITSAYYGNIVQRLIMEGDLKINAEHKINEISFGENNYRYEIWSNFEKNIAMLSQLKKNMNNIQVYINII